MARQARRIADRLAETADRTFAGRARELARLKELAGSPAPGPLVVFVHGPGGIGKSRLLHALSATVPAQIRLTRVDCATVEPTPAGFLAAACAARDVELADPEPEAVADLLGGGGGRAVLALDHYEAFGLIDAWLRIAFLPLLSEGVLTILAAREPPGPGWRRDPGWSELVEELELAELAEPEARALLAGQGMSAEQSDRVLAFARGHPLALTLAAAAMRERPSLELAAGPPPAVVGGLVRVILAGLEPDTVEAVEAASVVRRTTEPILRALMDRGSAREPYGRLRDLPFADQTRDGLVLHEVARSAIVLELGHRDPEALARYRARAAAHLSGRVRRTRSSGLWDLTADLLYLVDHPLVHDAFFAPGAAEHSVELATAADHDAIGRAARAWEPGADDWLEPWWAHHADAFRVVRDADGEVIAFFLSIELSTLDPAILDADPVARRVAGHLRADGLDRGWRSLLVRRAVSLRNGERLSPELAATSLDVKRSYLELRPRLRRVYVASIDPEPSAAAFAALGFTSLGQPVRLGAASYACSMLDMGERSVDGWLSHLLDVSVADDSGSTEPPGGRAEAAGPVADLSPREVEVLRLLADGLANRAIAERLVISDKTVGRHLEHIYAKLGVKSRAHAARMAAESGLTGVASGP